MVHVSRDSETQIVNVNQELGGTVLRHTVVTAGYSEADVRIMEGVYTYVVPKTTSLVNKFFRSKVGAAFDDKPYYDWVFTYPSPGVEKHPIPLLVAGDTVRVDAGVLYVNGEIYESNFAERDGDHSCVPAWTDPESCPAPHTKRDQAAYVGNPRMKSWPWRDGERPYVVPEGHIFMMGDNRFNSMDSRYWGPLDVDLIKGKAMFIYWSWNGERHLPRLNRIGDLIR